VRLITLISKKINSYGKPLNNSGSNILGQNKTPNLMILREEKEVFNLHNIGMGL
jgi:hypothetical protein